MMFTFYFKVLMLACSILGTSSFSIHLRAASTPGKFIGYCPHHRSSCQSTKDPLMMALRPPINKVAKQTKGKSDEAISSLLKSLLPDFKNVKLQSATNALIATNLAISLTALAIPQLKSGMMKIDSKIMEGEFWRLFTSLFVHGNVAHVAMNSYTLFNFGRQSEPLYGWKNFLLIYLGAGVLANVITLVTGTAPQALGASGSTYGLLGAIGAFYVVNQKILGDKSSQALDGIKRNLMVSLFFAVTQGGSIGQTMAHFCGVAAGFAIAYGLVPQPKKIAAPPKRHIPSYSYRR